ncbi:Glutaredoxin-C4 [Zostera marina]|uniref:Glutaredoxin-C4 n=1 Tax=Zostera marina TaxID=29655 RepID=A0A0K9PEA7_ZOSMR|nr:Glutaredoxin-C4 [Zostera marina]
MALSKFHSLSLSILQTKPISRKATFATQSFAHSHRDLQCSISLRRTHAFNAIAGYRGDPVSPVLGTRRTGMLMTIVVAGCFISNSASAGRDGAAATKEEVFIKNTITSHDIVIFSKSYCPYCQLAKNVFLDLDKKPYVVELDERDDGSDIQYTLNELVGKQTVPQVFVKGKHVGGSDDTVEAYESGVLTELLGSNS